MSKTSAARASSAVRRSRAGSRTRRPQGRGDLDVAWAVAARAAAVDEDYDAAWVGRELERAAEPVPSLVGIMYLPGAVGPAPRWAHRRALARRPCRRPRPHAVGGIEESDDLVVA